MGSRKKQNWLCQIRQPVCNQLLSRTFKCSSTWLIFAGSFGCLHPSGALFQLTVVVQGCFTSRGTAPFQTMGLSV